MRSIQRAFINTKQLNPYWSDFTCFTETIKHKDFGHRVLSRWFNILVDEEDYYKGDRREILSFLRELNKVEGC